MLQAYRAVDTSKIYPPSPSPAERPFSFHAAQLKLDVSGQETRHWVLYLKEDQTFEQAEDPPNYKTIMNQNVAPKRSDFIKVFNYDKSQFIELYVIAADKIRLRTERIRSCERAEVESPKDAKLKTRWNVGKRVHEVVRGEGPETVVIMSDFQLKEDAVAWLIDHEKKMNS